MSPRVTGSDEPKLLIGEAQTKEYRLANELVGRLNVLLRNVRTHGRNNRAVAGNAETALSKINGLLDTSGKVTFDIVGKSLFLNGIRLTPDFANFQAFKGVVSHVKDRSIRSFSFDDSVDEDDLIAFASILASVDPDEEDPYAEVVERMEAEGVAGIEISRVEAEASLPSRRRSDATGGAAAAAYAAASSLYFIGKVFEKGIADAGVTPRKMKRVVQLVVDAVLADGEDMLSLTPVKAPGARLERHSLNVCIYSLILAHRLGLPKHLLREVGVAALFHDCGRTDAPAGAEGGAAHDHTWRGVKELTHFKEADRTILRAMLVAYLHHLNIDASGYPRTGRRIEPDAVSRIVRIADVYDTLTSPPSPDLPPSTSRDALATILSNAGERLDPAAAGTFAHAVARPSA